LRSKTGRLGSLFGKSKSIKKSVDRSRWSLAQTREQEIFNKKETP